MVAVDGFVRLRISDDEEEQKLRVETWFEQPEDQQVLRASDRKALDIPSMIESENNAYILGHWVDT